MCGIAGILSSSAVEPAMLDTMAQRLAHRGPDGQGRHVAGNVGLLHTRLAVIDLEGGAQPLYNEDRSLALVANGEIYNYRELRAELETLGHRFATHSDCETLLHGYEAWGMQFVERLQGMFAFALHDMQRGELILARDRLGIKPLYICHGSRGLAFASEVKALLPWLGTPEVNAHGLARFLQSNFTSSPQTLLQGVNKLPPGHLARIDTRTLQFEQHAYWSPLHVVPLDIGLDDAIERFDALMHDVMDIHMRADVPLGLFLSGGVDSSLLAALLAQRVDEPLRTFSVGFPGTSVHNELDAARRAQDLLRRLRRGRRAVRGRARLRAPRRRRARHRAPRGARDHARGRRRARPGPR
ncbi:MAG TPA: asparagine synthase (glutamine-hydrolyzing), partial [Thiobacillus sp.]